MKRFVVTLFASYMLLICTTALPVTATAINFETQAANTGGNLTGIPDSPLTVGIATFTGGELRNGEIGLNSDQTGVYASQGLFGSGETNPLVITFASPVRAFSVFVANGDDVRRYTVSDNLGDSITMSLASAGSLGAATFSLPGDGITMVNISSSNADAWDFAIDNLTFTAATAAPEPRTPLLLGSALVVLAVLRRKQLSRR
ncbi:MAG TPA: PEP-CTERM sorting domain-containing protein [Edaphobacter sp.]|nr:PEP-CTERM sorting domain-containing protein [Edaphobacter sp.]